MFAACTTTGARDVFVPDRAHRHRRARDARVWESCQARQNDMLSTFDRGDRCSGIHSRVPHPGIRRRAHGPEPGSQPSFPATARAAARFPAPDPHAFEQLERDAEAVTVELEIVAQPARGARHRDDSRAEGISPPIRAAWITPACTSSSSSASSRPDTSTSSASVTTRCSSSQTTSVSGSYALREFPPRIRGRLARARRRAHARARSTSRARRSARPRTGRPRRHRGAAARARRAAASARTKYPRGP